MVEWIRVWFAKQNGHKFCENKMFLSLAIHWFGIP